MEIKTITKQAYKSVKAGTYEEKVYVAFDGEEFRTEEEAHKHEARVKFKSIEFRDKDFPEFNISRWYRAKDEEELEILKRYFNFYKNSYHRVYVYGDIVPNKWFGIDFYDGGDYPNTTCFVSLAYIKEEIKKYLDTIEDYE